MEPPKDYAEGMDQDIDSLMYAMRVDSEPSVASTIEGFIAKHSLAFALLAGVVIGVIVGTL